ncbi:hypothetical protein FBZ86_1461 [Gluconacetobacter diazotrophicus]|nr:hypothetical protein FBZ86_1461 [Gluconacetobacter diazotrophicus]
MSRKGKMGLFREPSPDWCSEYGKRSALGHNTLIGNHMVDARIGRGLPNSFRIAQDQNRSGPSRSRTGFAPICSTRCFPFAPS